MKKTIPQAKQPSQSAKVTSKVPRPPKPSVIHTLAEEPKKSSYWRMSGWYVAWFLVAVVVFAICAWLVHKHLLLGKEHQILRFINDWPEKLRLGFVAVTALGSFWAGAVLVAMAFVFRLHQLAWRLALSIFTIFGLLLVLKHLFVRIRPEAVLSDIHVRVLETSFAFPSAHAAVATVLALTIRTYLPIPAIWQWLVVVLWIGAVGLSRIYLGVHTPLDIAAGVALGTGVVCFWRILPTPLKRFLRLH